MFCQKDISDSVEAHPSLALPISHLTPHHQQGITFTPGMLLVQDPSTGRTLYQDEWCELCPLHNSSEPAAVGGSGFQFLPLKKSGVDWNRYENHPISQLKNYAYLDENMPYPIQPISHYAAAHKLTTHKFYLAVAQDRHKPPGESGHVSLFTRSYACAALKISGRSLLS